MLGGGATLAAHSSKVVFGIDIGLRALTSVKELKAQRVLVKSTGFRRFNVV